MLCIYALENNSYRKLQKLFASVPLVPDAVTGMV
jgi:hypothetical protein